MEKSSNTIIVAELEEQGRPAQAQIEVPLTLALALDLFLAEETANLQSELNFADAQIASLQERINELTKLAQTRLEEIEERKRTIAGLQRPTLVHWFVRLFEK